jgi:hypothetical protein
VTQGQDEGDIAGELRTLAGEMANPAEQYRDFPAWRARSLGRLAELGDHGLASAEFRAKTDELRLPAPALAEEWDVWEFESKVHEAAAILLGAAEGVERRAPWAAATRPRIASKEVRDAIADAIAENVKAYDVPGVCTMLGLVGGDPQDDPMRSKRVYVSRRLTTVTEQRLVEVARALDEEYGLPELAGLAAGYAAQLAARSAPVAESGTRHLAELRDWESVRRSWTAAAGKVDTDPEGAITAARTTLESTCKHICDERNIPYEAGWDLSKLYKAASGAMELTPDQHEDAVIKQILGGVGSVVGGLSAMRNSMSDSHGRGKRNTRPAPRHARLAVNTALGVAGFLIDTHVEKKRTSSTG